MTSTRTSHVRRAVGRDSHMIAGLGLSRVMVMTTKEQHYQINHPGFVLNVLIFVAIRTTISHNRIAIQFYSIVEYKRDHRDRKWILILVYEFIIWFSNQVTFIYSLVLYDKCYFWKLSVLMVEWVWWLCNSVRSELRNKYIHFVAINHSQKRLIDRDNVLFTKRLWVTWWYRMVL